MKYLYLVWKNMTRKKFRAIFTFFSIVVAFALFGMLTSLAGVFSGEARFSDEDRLFILNKYDGTLPISYVDRIKSIDGIVPERVTYQTAVAAYFRDEQELFALQGRDPDATVASFQSGDRYRYDIAELESWARRRDGVLLQQRVADEYELEVGDSLTLTTPGFTKDDGTNTWEFVVSGIYDFRDPDEDPMQVIFHYDYLDEARTEGKGTVQLIVNIVESPDQAERIAREIDAMFANSAYETQTGTEDSLTRDYFRRVGNMGFAIYLILGAVFLTMVLVTANTMIQAFRERVHEIGVLKTLGFSSTAVLALVLAEALLILSIGGAIGLVIAWYIVELAQVQVTNMFYLGPGDIAIGAAIIVVVGLAVGLVPALQARRLTITQALGRS